MVGRGRSCQAAGCSRNSPKDGNWSKPDLIISLWGEPFEVPASGPDIYRNFTIPMDVPETKWVQAIEYRPAPGK